MRVRGKNKKDGSIRCIRRICLLSKSKRNKILNSIEKRFGVELNPNTLVRIDDRIYIYTGEDINIEPEIVGLNIGEIKGDEFKPSIEGSQIINPKKNFYNINQNTALKWMQGSDITVDEPENLTAGYVIVKCGNDIMGAGKFNGKIIKNNIQKNRKLKFK